MWNISISDYDHKWSRKFATYSYSFQDVYVIIIITICCIISFCFLSLNYHHNFHLLSFLIWYSTQQHMCNSIPSRLSSIIDYYNANRVNHEFVYSFDYISLILSASLTLSLSLPLFISLYIYLSLSFHSLSFCLFKRLHMESIATWKYQKLRYHNHYKTMGLQ